MTVEEGSPSKDALTRGDVILQINRDKISSAKG
jgi:hypothetical protein